MRRMYGDWNTIEHGSSWADAKTGEGPQQINEPTDVIPEDTSTPYTLTIGGSETGVVNFVGDHDWFGVQLTAGQSYVFTMNGSGSLSDTYLELYDENGALLAFDDDGQAPGGGSLLRFTASSTGTYYLNARAFEDDSASNTGDYTVNAAIGPPQNPLDTIDLHYTAPLHIDVYFATSGQTFNGISASRSWTASEQSAAMAALATWAAVTPITFSITASSASAEFILTLAPLGAGVLGQFQTVGGIGYGDFAPSGFGWTTAGLLPGGAGFTTLIHEFGHGLGFAHPHDNGGGSEVMQGVLGPFGSYGTYLMDQGVFTVMSYNDGWSLKPDGGTVTSTAGNEATPGPLDIALAQLKYGINATTNAGDTAYVISSAAGPYKAIWDVSGTDSISFSGSAAATIDLRPATLVSEIGGGGFVSHIAGVQGGFTIANGVVIENATSGSGADTLIGNSAANILNGGAGADSMTGGLGDDIYVVDNAGDVVTENASEGVDTIQSSVIYVLPANVENLTLTGTAANGIGNTLDNVITGNASNNFLSGGDGNDTLDGAGGADAMNGGLGNDTFIVDNAGDNANENSGEGTDTVQASINYTLTANVENLVLLGATLNGTGNDLNNTITGNGAANTLDGGTGADTMIGGLGDDIYFVDNGGDVVTENVGEGTDVVHASINYTLTANVENLTLTGSAINGMGNALANVITGNSAANSLSGFDGNDTLYGLDGNDVLDGGAGADVMNGNNGDDTYYVDNAGDVVFEGLINGGTDLVIASVNYSLTGRGYTENLTLVGAATTAFGNPYDNVLTGNAADNTLYGLDGNDVLDGGAGADIMNGNLGNDTFIVDNAGDAVGEGSASGGIDLVLSSVSFNLAYTGYAENLTLTGSDPNTATGNKLNNILIGNAANNTLYGLDGNDTLDGGVGADIMNGNNGDDTYYVDNAGDIAVEGSPAGGADTIISSISFNLNNAGYVENLTLTGSAINATGNALNNVLTGNALNNTLYGLDGNDTLDGRAGADVMNGNLGDDTYIVDNAGDVAFEGPAAGGTDQVFSSVSFNLAAAGNMENLTLTGSAAINGAGNAFDNIILGNDAANVLTGNDGNDTLDGGAGVDTMIGGAGADSFTFTAGQANGDIIQDFDGAGAATGDALHFSGYGAAIDGATFVQLDATHWQINSADGTIHDLITLANSATVDPTDYVFGP
jgi:Ca2+-binding RTX toxin-like protein